MDFEFDRRRVRDEVTPDEVKERMKKMGVEPMSPYQEKPFYISSTGAVLDAYVPAEGDGKVREACVIVFIFFISNFRQV